MPAARSHNPFAAGAERPMVTRVASADGEGLVLVGQLLEQPIPIGNIASELAFQPLQNRPCQRGVVAGSLQHPDRLALS